MAVDLMKVLRIISSQASLAQGHRSFGGPKIGGGKALGIEDGDEVGEGEIHGLPAEAQAPGEELNRMVQDHVLGHQDHELPDDEYIPGEEPVADEPEPDEMQAPKKTYAGFMSTNAVSAKEPTGIHETAKRRRGRPRGSKA